MRFSVRQIAPVALAAAAGLVPSTSRATPSGGPEVTAGVLSSPSRAPAAQIARDYLASAPTTIAGVDPAALRDAGVHAAGRDRAGSIVELRQTFRGLDVVGGSVAVRIDDRGQVRWSASSVREIPADLDLTPTLDAPAAIAAAYAGPGARELARTVEPSQHARLVVWALGAGSPRLAWQVVLPADLRVVETLLVYLDAHTGQVLYTENLAKQTNQANVFLQDPVATPNTEQVTLQGVIGPHLESADILARNCVDQHNCTTVDLGGTTLSVHMCDFVPTATADGNGDFLYTRPASDLDPEDTFAEVQMYYHATEAYAFFRGFGFGNLNAHPMQVVANFRTPPFDQTGICLGTTTSNGPLNPLDNAAFVPAGGLGGFPPDDMLLFGQGTGADLGYEGDVIFHEMGHAVASAVNTIAVAVPDAYGLNTTSGGMSEGYSDYFAGAATNDPQIGEYSGPSFGLGGPIRDMDNTDTCPRSIQGEVHADSLPWTGALWEIRASLPVNDRPTFDQAVYDAFTTIVESDDMISVAAKTLAEIQTALGTTVHDAAAAIFAARGFDDCDHRVIDAATEDSHPLVSLYGTDQIAVGTVPGPLQWKLTLTSDASSIDVTIAAAQAAGGGFGGGAAPAVKLLVKEGNEPIQWTWGPSSTSNDATSTGDVALATSGATHASLSGNFPAGTYHVMLADAGGSVYLQGVHFSATAAAAPDAGVGPDAGGNPDDGGSGGCCDAGSHDAPAGGLLLAALVALGVRRRRR